MARETTASRLITLIEAVATEEHGVGVREFARSSGIDKSAISRLFAQLEELRVVEKSDLTGRYSVGPRLAAVAARLYRGSSLWSAAQPVVELLSDRYDESCYVTVRDGAAVVFQYKVDCVRPIRYVIELGRVASLHAGAGGRAILAGVPAEEADRLVGAMSLEAVTHRTLTRREDLRRAIAQDRDRGYSVSVEERVVGGMAIAAPFFGGDGTCVGSIVFTRPLVRHDPDVTDEIAASVVTAARELSERLGAPRAATSPASGPEAR